MDGFSASSAVSVSFSSHFRGASMCLRGGRASGPAHPATGLEPTRSHQFPWKMAVWSVPQGRGSLPGGRIFHRLDSASRLSMLACDPHLAMLKWAAHWPNRIKYIKQLLRLPDPDLNQPTPLSKEHCRPNPEPRPRAARPRTKGAIA